MSECVGEQKISDPTQLEVYKMAHELTILIYKLTANFPKEELFGLSSQMKRAASSICANLMEGSYRNNTKEFRQFCGIARGSAGELKYFLILSSDLGYLDKNIAMGLITKTDTISKMIYGLIKSLERKI
ncbi:four helix bundle protein [Calditerrivibrio nitroreducens]|uniref:four helix bundle protein n=1 Tax=Calditerrivibrio nitroreducens TaxID=477976 RepID=UPI001FE0E496|nr:four helix bundle protein [Calditerrivibrio nitroreducens]